MLLPTTNFLRIFQINRRTSTSSHTSQSRWLARWWILSFCEFLSFIVTKNMSTESLASLARGIFRLRSRRWPAGMLGNHNGSRTFTQQRWEVSTVFTDYFHSHRIPQFSLYSFYWHYLLAPTHTDTHTDINSNTVKKQWMTGIRARAGGFFERLTGATAHYYVQTYSASNTNTNRSCDITFPTWQWRNVFHRNTELRLLSDSHAM
jgi:hypothetical protein